MHRAGKIGTGYKRNWAVEEQGDKYGERGGEGDKGACQGCITSIARRRFSVGNIETSWKETHCSGLRN